MTALYASTLFALVGTSNSELQRRVTDTSPCGIGPYVHGRSNLVAHARIDLARSDASKLVLTVTVEHLGEMITYTDHEIVCKASRRGVSVRVSGSNHHGAKDRLTDAYREWLTAEIEP